jgi:hypothetical protein
MSDDHESVESKLVDWLSTQGFALEYQTYNAFSDVGLQPILSNYVQNEDETWREIDVSASSLLNEPGREPIGIRVCCECKYSKSRPWVLMEAADTINYGALCWTQLPASAHFVPLRIQNEIEAADTHLRRALHFQPRQQWAHTLVQGLRKDGDNRDDAFNALRKISDAAWDWAAEWTRQGITSAIIVIPCIVVEADLYRATFNSTERRFEEYGRLLWNGCRGGTLVDVVQAGSIESYAKKLKATFSVVLNILKSSREKGLFDYSISMG